MQPTSPSWKLFELSKWVCTSMSSIDRRQGYKYRLLKLTRSSSEVLQTVGVHHHRFGDILQRSYVTTSDDMQIRETNRIELHSNVRKENRFPPYPCEGLLHGLQRKRWCDSQSILEKGEMRTKKGPNGSSHCTISNWPCCRGAILISTCHSLMTS